MILIILFYLAVGFDILLDVLDCLFDFLMFGCFTVCIGCCFVFYLCSVISVFWLRVGWCLLLASCLWFC